MAIRVGKKVNVLTVGKQKGFIVGTYDETRDNGTITCIRFKMENGAYAVKKLYTDNFQDLFFQQLATQLNMLGQAEDEIYTRALEEQLPIDCYIYNTYDEHGNQYPTPTLDIFESKAYKEWLLACE